LVRVVVVYVEPSGYFSVVVVEPSGFVRVVVFMSIISSSGVVAGPVVVGLGRPPLSGSIKPPTKPPTNELGIVVEAHPEPMFMVPPGSGVTGVPVVSAGTVTGPWESVEGFQSLVGVWGAGVGGVCSAAQPGEATAISPKTRKKARRADTVFLHEILTAVGSGYIMVTKYASAPGNVNSAYSESRVLPGSP